MVSVRLVYLSKLDCVHASCSYILCSYFVPHYRLCTDSSPSIYCGFSNAVPHLKVCVSQEIATKIATAITNLSQKNIKRTRIEATCPAPSTLGDTTKWIQYNDLMGVRCHRAPPQNCHSLHVTLQIQAFGEFMDALEGDVDSRYVRLAHQLMADVSPLLLFESVFQEKVLKHLNNLFQSDSMAYMVSSKNWSGGAARSDITVYVNGVVLANFEIKGELCLGNKEPNLENIGYFVKFQQNREGERAPMFLITIAGCHHLQVFGAVWNNSVICVDPLCSPVSLLYVPHDPNDGIRKVARVLSALRFGVDKLYESSLKQDIMKRSGPYFDAFDGKQIHYLGRMNERRRLYEAKVDGKDVVVKFVWSRYGLDAHKKLAELKLAPECIYSEHLPGKWIVVVMEKIMNGFTVRQPNEDLKRSLYEAMQKLHSLGFVHGDLRPQNILALPADKGVRIVDFDWCGPLGEAKYPADINLSEDCGWHEGVTSGGLIQKEHDAHQISALVSDN